MAAFVKGDVVVVPFPFSDLTAAKRRPALVIAALDRNDVILCQITSKATSDGYAVSLDDHDFDTGGLKRPSNVRPNHIFTADSALILYCIGRLKQAKLNTIIAALVEILRSS